MPPSRSHGGASPAPLSLVAAALLAAAWVVSAGAWSAPFVFDDPAAIAHAARIVRTPALATLVSAGPDAGETTSGRPVLALSLALNYALGGEAAAGYRVVNVAIHSLAALVLLGVTRRTLLSQALPAPMRGAAFPIACGVAMLWLVHPLQTQAVTYVVQRGESLAGLFLLLALYTFIRALEASQPRRWFAASALAGLLGAATKESTAALPIIVLLYDRTFHAGTVRAALRSRPWYYGSLAVTWVLLALLVWGTGGRGGTAGFDAGVSSWSYLLTQSRALTLYLGLTVWPAALTFDYGTPLVSHLADALPGIALIGGAAVATIWLIARRSAWGFVGGWFFLVLAPSSSVVPIASQTIAEHRMYLALAAPVLAGVVVLYAGLGRRAYGVLALVALAWIGLSYQRNTTYRSEYALWSDTVAKAPANARARQNLGLAELHRGQVVAALGHLQQSVALNPTVADAHYNLGLCLARLGRTTEAVGSYERALALRSDHARARNNLGSALLTLGRASEARTQLEAAVKLNPGFAESHSNLSDALLQLGNTHDALRHAREAVHLAPASSAAHFNAGNACAALRQFSEARRFLETAVQLAPSDPHPHNNLGNVLLELDRPADALAHYEKAVALAPSLVDPRRNLALLLLHLGRPRDAEPHLEVLSRLLPNNPEVARALREARSRPAR